LLLLLLLLLLQVLRPALRHLGRTRAVLVRRRLVGLAVQPSHEGGLPLHLSSFSLFFTSRTLREPWERTLRRPSSPSLRDVAPRAAAAASVALPRRFSPSRALPTCPCSFSGAPAAPPLRRFYPTLLSTLPILLVLHPLLLRTTLLSTFAAFSLNPCRPGFFHDARCRRTLDAPHDARRLCRLHPDETPCRPYLQSLASGASSVAPLSVPPPPLFTTLRCRLAFTFRSSADQFCLMTHTHSRVHKRRRGVKCTRSLCYGPAPCASYAASPGHSHSGVLLTFCNSSRSCYAASGSRLKLGVTG